MLLDYGSDINCIYRTNRNIVMTPLDCALQKGFRSTAKFLQLHGGLPASKLRLSGRKPNALTDQELVTPLNFKTITSTAPIGAAATAAAATSSSPHHGGDKDVKRFVVYINHSESDENSCDEKVPKRAHHKSRSICHHHRHRYRMRTSSCETYAVHKDDDSCSDMCRSKSNIEIHRRRKSRHKRDSSSFSDDSSASSVDCCRHRRRNRHRHKRSSRKKSKSKEPQDSSECDGSCKRKQKKEKRSSGATESKYSVRPKHDQTKGDAAQNCDQHDAEIVVAKNVDENIDSHNVQESGQKSEDSRAKSGTMKRPQSARASSAKQRAQKQEEVQLRSAVVESKMEKISEVVVESGKMEISTSEESKHEALLNDSESAEAIEITTKADVHVSNETLESNVAQSESKEMENVHVDHDNAQSTNTAENDNNDVGKKDDDTTEVSTSLKVESHPEPNSSSDNHTASNPSETADVCDADVQEPPKSLETLEENSEPTSFEVRKENSEDPQQFPGQQEPRKSSFTVLASDESVDQTDLFSGTEQERPKSFKVLSSLEKDDEEDDDEEEYYSSDDEHILPEPTDQIRRLTSEHKKGYKQSKQFSVDIPNKALDKTLQQHSKDQDSGFEPSPRAMRTKIPTPQSVYTAATPRKTTATSGQDERTVSSCSRQDGRKPGDRNAVNMTTVSQSIQKNIRR